MQWHFKVKIHVLFQTVDETFDKKVQLATSDCFFDIKNSSHKLSLALPVILVLCQIYFHVDQEFRDRLERLDCEVGDGNVVGISVDRCTPVADLLVKVQSVAFDENFATGDGHKNKGNQHESDHYWSLENCE